MAEAAKDLHPEEEKDLQPLEPIKDEAKLPKDKADNVVELKTLEKNHDAPKTPNDTDTKVLPFKKPENNKEKELSDDYFGHVKSMEEGIFTIISERTKGHLSGTTLHSLTQRYCNLFPPLEYFLNHGSEIVTPEAAKEMLKGINSAQELKASPLFKKIVTDPIVVARFEKASRNEVYKLGIPEEVKELQKTRNIISALRAKLRVFLMSNREAA